MNVPDRNQVKIGSRVWIEIKRNQGHGKLTEGAVKEILTHSESHPYGIKVKLQDGQVGRVKKIEPFEKTEPTVSGFVDLHQIKIPKTESKGHEFKEFYQYDRAIKNMIADQAQNRSAIEKIKQRGKTEVARAVCSFGNDHAGGFVYLGIRSDGGRTGLEQDKKLENFDDYEDRFANHIRDALEKFLGDKPFIVSKLQIVFRTIEGKTICIIQILPSSQPLFLNVGDGKDFFVRGPAPRAEKLDGRYLFRYIKERFPNYG